MQQEHIKPIILKFAQLLESELHESELAENLKSYNQRHLTSLSMIVDVLNKQSAVCKMIFQFQLLPKQQALELLKNPEFPVLVFINQPNITPAIAYFSEIGKKQYQQPQYEVFNDEGEQKNIPFETIANIASLNELQASNTLGEIHFQENQSDYIPFITAVKIGSVVSDFKQEQMHTLTPMKRVFSILKNEKKDISLIYFYAIMMGVVSLALPLGIQAIVGLISGGLFLNSVIVLIAIVVVATLIAGWIQVLQLTVVESLQQRLFAKAAFEFAYRIPRIKIESIANKYAPELMNRFFDVMTIQKNLPKILIDLSSAGIQILFGIIMLSLYHPLFIIFGLVLILVIIVIFYFTSAKALESNIVSSKYKYKVAYWIEELARTLHTFKLTGQFNFPVSKMDKLLSGYLTYRQMHFGTLVKQFKAIIAFKVFITAGLLIIGSILVVERQINLGQFVAAEIIILLVISSVEKLISTLENVYDLLTAVDKVGNVTDLPLENEKGIDLEELVENRNINLNVNNLSYAYSYNSKAVLKNLTMEVKAFQKIGIAGPNGSGKSTLARILAGLYEDYKGNIIVNGLPLREINANSYRNRVSDNLIEQDIFEGTLEENISLKKQHVTIKQILDAIEITGATSFVQNLSEGIKSTVEAGAVTLPNSIRQKILLARCIVNKPYILIIDEKTIGLGQLEKERILNYLFDPANQFTLILISNNHQILKKCDNLYLMDEGSVIAEGSYETIQSNPVFQSI